MVRKKMPHEVYQKVLVYRKNRKDISSLLEPYVLKGLDLSGTIIKKFERINDDLTGINFSHCIIGESGSSTVLTGSVLNNSNFYKTKFLGRLKANHVTARDCNFNKCYMPFVSYKKADLRGSTFCSAIWQWGNDCGAGAKFSKETLEEFFKHWVTE